MVGCVLLPDPWRVTEETASLRRAVSSVTSQGSGSNTHPTMFYSLYHPLHWTLALMLCEFHFPSRQQIFSDVREKSFHHFAIAVTAHVSKIVPHKTVVFLLSYFSQRKDSDKFSRFIEWKHSNTTYERTKVPVVKWQQNCIESKNLERPHTQCTAGILMLERSGTGRFYTFLASVLTAKSHCRCMQWYDDSSTIKILQNGLQVLSESILMDRFAS